MSSFKKMARRVVGNERGITGLETAIILIAFVVVATVFAFVVLTTGIFSAERGKETVYAGLQKARGTLEVRGGVIVESTGSPLAVSSIKFDVANTAGGDPVPLNPGGTTNSTIISFASGTTYVNNLTYTVNPIVGTDTNLLQPGDLDEIVISASDPANTAIAALAANGRWTLTVQTPVGAVVDITRSMPAELSAVMQLH